MDWLTPETINTIFGNAFSHQVVQFGTAFMIAAWMHAKQVRKEIALQTGLTRDESSAHMDKITTSIDNVAKVLRQDLSKQGERIDNIENGISSLNDRVWQLETPKKE